MLIHIIGAVAATLTMFGFVPQIVRSLRTMSVKDVSPGMIYQFMAGVSLWAIYGIYRRDLIIIIANIVTLLSLIFLLALYIYFEKMPNRKGKTCR